MTQSTQNQPFFLGVFLRCVSLPTPAAPPSGNNQTSHSSEPLKAGGEVGILLVPTGRPGGLDQRGVMEGVSFFWWGYLLNVSSGLYSLRGREKKTNEGSFPTHNIFPLVFKNSWPKAKTSSRFKDIYFIYSEIIFLNLLPQTTERMETRRVRRRRSPGQEMGPSFTYA